MLEEPVVEQRQAEENPFARELFSNESLGTLGKDVKNLGKDVLTLGKDALMLARDVADAEVQGIGKVAGVLKSIAAQFEKYGDKLLMALKPQEKCELNDSINKMGCPMSKLRAALAKVGGDSAKEDSEESQKKSA